MAELQAERAARLSSVLADPLIDELERRVRRNPGLLRRMGVEKLMRLAAGAAKVLPSVQLAERLARIGGDGRLAPEAESADPKVVNATFRLWESTYDEHQGNLVGGDFTWGTQGEPKPDPLDEGD
jgi:hypothetical protein